MPGIVTLEIVGEPVDGAIMLAALSMRLAEDAQLDYEHGETFARLRFERAAYPVALTKTKRAVFMVDPNEESLRVLEGQ